MTTTVKFPTELTKREILTIEELSGVPIDQVGATLTNPEKPKMRLAAVLTLVALRRTEPSSNLDTVLDGDYELELPDGNGNEVVPPLPPPSATAD